MADFRFRPHAGLSFIRGEAFVWKTGAAFQELRDALRRGGGLALQDRVRGVENLNLEQVAENAQIFEISPRDQPIFRAGQCQNGDLDPRQGDPDVNGQNFPHAVREDLCGDGAEGRLNGGNH